MNFKKMLFLSKCNLYSLCNVFLCPDATQASSYANSLRVHLPPRDENTDFSVFRRKKDQKFVFLPKEKKNRRRKKKLVLRTISTRDKILCEDADRLNHVHGCSHSRGRKL